AVDGCGQLHVKTVAVVNRRQGSHRCLLERCTRLSFVRAGFGGWHHRLFPAHPASRELRIAHGSPEKDEGQIADLRAPEICKEFLMNALGGSYAVTAVDDHPVPQGADTAN